MKSSITTTILVLVIIAFLLTGLGGWLDMTDGKLSVSLTSHHAWNDGLFLMLLAILIAVLYSSST